MPYRLKRRIVYTVTSPPSPTGLQDILFTPHFRSHRERKLEEYTMYTTLLLLLRTGFQGASRALRFGSHCANRLEEHILYTTLVLHCAPASIEHHVRCAFFPILLQCEEHIVYVTLSLV